MNTNYKYKSLSEFRKEHPNLYNQLHKRNMVDKLCEDMGWVKKNIIKKPYGYWTKELCIKEAIKYENNSEFGKKSVGAYQAALRNDWMVDINHIFNSKQIIKIIKTQREEYNYTFKQIAENLNKLNHKTITGKEYTTANTYRLYKDITNKKKIRTYFN
jgi:hypothetical protein